MKYKLMRLYNVDIDPETSLLMAFPINESIKGAKVKALYKNKETARRYRMKRYLQETPFWMRDLELSSKVFSYIEHAVLTNNIPCNNITGSWHDMEPADEGGYGIKAINAKIDFNYEQSLIRVNSFEYQLVWLYYGNIFDKKFEGVASSKRLAIAESLKCVYRYAKRYYPDIKDMFENKTLRYRTYAYIN